jgi:hypothetical protein
VENSDLKDLIDNVAARGQVLSKEGRDFAHIVRRAGNEVLHDEPTASDALQVVESAREVIRLLHGK